MEMYIAIRGNLGKVFKVLGNYEDEKRILNKNGC